MDGHVVSYAAGPPVPMTYTTSEVAAALGVSRRRVVQACNRDNLGEKRGRDWLITDEDIAYLRSRLGKRGRPGA